ncbi:hypothetical protein C8R43DRAFT_961742 [Mycena crocata]|nr:hypothetical protein C8R43DRAFT_961742 [Mycena crocata]
MRRIPVKTRSRTTQFENKDYYFERLLAKWDRCYMAHRVGVARIFEAGLVQGRLCHVTFAFDMVPGDTGEELGVDAALKLHMSAVGDSTSVTLTVFVSGESKAQSQDVGFQDVSGAALPANIQSSNYYAFDDTPSREHLLDSGDNSVHNLCFDLRAIQSMNIANQLFDAFNCDCNADILFDTDISCLGLAGREDSVMDIGVMFSESLLLDISEHAHPQNCLDYEADASVDDSTPSSFTNEGTPVSSCSSPSRSSTPQRSSGSRRDLRCPHPTCDLYFATSYKLAKHMTTCPEVPEAIFVHHGLRTEIFSQARPIEARGGATREAI